MEDCRSQGLFSRYAILLVAVMAVVAAVAGTILRNSLAPDLASPTTYHSFQRPLMEGMDYALTQAPDGNFYGVAQDGGIYGNGCIFRETPAGATTIVYTFGQYAAADRTNVGGYWPDSKLALGSNGALYGVTEYGGSSGDGTVFELTTGGTFATVLNFTGTGGAYPGAEPNIIFTGTAGSLYGTTYSGGADGYGSVFEISSSGVFSSLASFTNKTGSDLGAYPNTMFQGVGGNLYGTTIGGGDAGDGTVFRIGVAGRFLNLASFTGDTGSTPGESPDSLIEASNANLYGTTSGGGTGGYGTVFEVTTDGSFTGLISFTYDTGSRPGAYPDAIVQAGDGNLYGATGQAEEGGTGSFNGTLFKMTLGGAFTNVVSFTNTAGAYPGADPSTLIVGSDGNVYGATALGGLSGYGSVFKLTTSGAFSSLASFSNSVGSLAGAYPETLVQCTNGELYGTTTGGGLGGGGVVFATSTGGSFKALPSLGPSDGQYVSTTVLGGDGNLYGLAEYGGVTGDGTIFKVTPAGVYSTFINFTGIGGAYPGEYPVALIQGDDGRLYGTTLAGGAGGVGTVFKVSLSGEFASLISFTPTGAHAGYYPNVLLQGRDGNLYGCTSVGGAGFFGTVFKVSTTGTFSNIATFTGKAGSTPGDYPLTMIQGTDGNLYGCTLAGGVDSYGTVFKLTTTGAFTNIAGFTGPTGSFPGLGPGPIVQGNDGNVYGTTLYGGSDYAGTIYRISSSGIENVASFTGTSGSKPGIGPQALVQAADGNLYGVTQGEGTFLGASVFQLSTNGSLTTIKQFAPTQLYGYYFTLIKASDGNLYGTLPVSGPNGTGEMFVVHPADGSVVDVCDFPAADTGEYPILNAGGAEPSVPLVQIGNSLFGVTSDGGENGLGVIYSVSDSPVIVAQPKAAQTAISTGTLTCRAVDPVSPNPTYTWSTVSAPVGAPSPTFSPNGTNAASTSTVTFGEESAYSFKCVIANGLGGRVTTQTVAITFKQPAPTITSFTPAFGAAGTAVTITGTNLVGISGVTFNGTAASSWVRTGTTTLAVRVPAGASPGPISVTTSAGTATSPGAFYEPPTISSFSPTSGAVGTTVTINGANLVGISSIEFNGVAVSGWTRISATSLSVKVPSGATPGPITLTTPGGTATSTQPFYEPPTIAAIAPSSGPVGTVVTISGANLIGISTIAFHGTPASVWARISETQLTVKVPSGATTGKVSLTTPGGTALSPAVFTVN